MPGNYLHAFRATGTLLTDVIYNVDHNDHVLNKEVFRMDDYSPDAATMRTNTDPYPAGAESLATSFAGELERMRYVLRFLTGLNTGRHWYHPDPPQGDPIFRQSFSA